MQGQLEHVLTRGASVKDDMAAVLGGLREGRSELLQALEADPAVAAELATKGADAAVEVRETETIPDLPARQVWRSLKLGWGECHNKQTRCFGQGHI